MIPLFLGLTLVNLLCLILAGTLGFLASRGRDVHGMHLLAGALATLVCVGVHCVVFTYFIATAKWVQHAVLSRRLDGRLLVATRSFKMQAFPAALGAMLAVIVSAALGAALDNAMIAPTWHLMATIVALAVNLFVAIIELRAIARNGRMIDEILAQLSPPP